MNTNIQPVDFVCERYWWISVYSIYEDPSSWRHNSQSCHNKSLVFS